MKKLMIILLTLALCSRNIECKKKINRFNEFVKGAIALGASAGFGYLAYDGDPIGLIKNQFIKLKKALPPKAIQKIDNAVKDLENSFKKKEGMEFNFENPFKGRSTWEKLDKAKLLSLFLFVPAWELFKYSLDKLGNCVRHHKDDLCKEKKE